MELTIQQALQQGVAAHKEGNLQDAERLYRSILQSQPTHPDANHNLGVLALSENKADVALPLFKIALEANPKIEQFWLSYVDALIKEKNFENAKEVLEQARKQGVAGENFNILEGQLTLINETEYIGSVCPSQEQLSTLLGHYQNARYDEAEKSAVSLSIQFPHHNFSWKILGAVLKKTGRASEAVFAEEKTIEITPDDAQAHSNLGVTLQELGRLKEAEVSLKQAIALKLDYAVAHSNLGNTLKELGRLDEAEASCREAIALKPDFAEAHSNLGNALKELGRLDEAEASYTQAIVLKPDYVVALSNLGNTLQELGRLDEAEANFTRAIELKPDYAEAHSNLGNTLHELGRLEEAEVNFTRAIELKPDFAVAHSNLGNTLKELGRIDEAEASYTQAIALKPNYAEATYNLGITLKDLGRLDEAEASLTQAIALKPDFAEAHSNLGVTLQELGRLDEAEASLRQAIVLNAKEPKFFRYYSSCITYLHTSYSANLSLEKLWEESNEQIATEIRLPLAIHKFMTNDLKGSRQLLSSHFADSSNPYRHKLELKGVRTLWDWLEILLDWHDSNCKDKILPPTQIMYVIGDSHTLSYQGITLETPNDIFLCKCEFIEGCKQWDLGQEGMNKFKYKFEKIIDSLPPTSQLLLSVGEIDCRIDVGVLPHCKKNPEKKIQQVINDTVSNYLNYILKKTSPYLHKITIQGIPCPNIHRDSYRKKKITELTDLVQEFNRVLKAKSKSYGFGFLDLSQITNDGKGFSNGLWHTDTWHLAPSGILEAWRQADFRL
jgi:tetratricopeptide (TPR) repeat protein